MVNEPGTERPSPAHDPLRLIMDMLILLLAEQTFVDGNLANAAKNRLLDAGILTN